MKPLYRLFFLLLLFAGTAQARPAAPPDTLYPLRGFCIAAPVPARLDEFVQFVRTELAPRKINTLVLRVDFNYRYESHPELRDSVALSRPDVRKLVRTCREAGIRLVPQINLLGHQSWASKTHNLLVKYPEFDETPHVRMPVRYAWPNADGLYCKSYCPLHPGVHQVVFELVDEICEAFEASDFHAGMDEVFYLGDDKCPRCGGRDRAELFAGEVSTIRNHLSLKNRRLWIWGDRLLDGKTTGLGMWEASMNQTHRAIDLIPRDVMICDWHYERPDPTPVLFASKGLDVITCPWRNPANALRQSDDMARFRASATPEMRSHFQGMMQTVWSDAGNFLDEYYGRKNSDSPNTASHCFRTLFPAP